MRALTHRALAGCAGLAAALALGAREQPALWALAAAAYAGGTAPDAWEYLGRRRWLPHRTLTHWPLPWLLLGGMGVGLLLQHDPAAQAVGLLLAGYALGALDHLLLDALTPEGIVLATPWDRFRPRRARPVPEAAAWAAHLATVALAAALGP